MPLNSLKITTTHSPYAVHETLPCDVIHQQCTSSPSVIRSGDWPKRFLSCLKKVNIWMAYIYAWWNKYKYKQWWYNQVLFLHFIIHSFTMKQEYCLRICTIISDQWSVSDNPLLLYLHAVIFIIINHVPKTMEDWMIHNHKFNRKTLWILKLSFQQIFEPLDHLFTTNCKI